MSMAAEPKQLVNIVDREQVVRALTDDFAVPVFITKQEAAAIARVTVRTIERWVKQGELRLFGPSHARRILLDDLLRWLGGVGDVVDHPRVVAGSAARRPE